MKKARVHMMGLFNWSRCGIKKPIYFNCRVECVDCGKIKSREYNWVDDWSKVTCKRCRSTYKTWHWQEADQAPWENN